MNPHAIRLHVLLLASLAFGLSASLLDAAWYWPFGDDRENEDPAVVQTQRSLALFQKAERFREEGREGKAAERYEDLFEDYPLSEYAPQSRFEYGKIMIEKKEWKDAFEAFQALLSRHPDFPHFNEVIRYQFDIASALAEGDGVRLLWVIPYNSYSRAVYYYELVINNAPYSDIAPLALMNIALIHQHRGNTAQAVEALDRLINNYPASTLTDEAYLTLADTFAGLVEGAFYDQGATREAISYYQDYLILFPTNQDVGKAEEGLSEMLDLLARSKLVIGQYYYKHRRNYLAAEIFFNEAITAAPESASAQRARDFLTRIDEFRDEEGRAPIRAPKEEDDDPSIVDRLFFWREQDRGSAIPPPPQATQPVEVEDEEEEE